jgi:hypothetical protein
MNVQNKKPAIEDINAVVDRTIVNKVFDIFESVLRLNPLQDLFQDLAERLIGELAAQSFMDINLELTKDQKEALTNFIKTRGNETARTYLANIDKDKRTQDVYGIVNDRAGSIADAVLAAIGQEINRGAIINAVAVQANAKSEKADEILLQKSKGTGDITIPTNCLLISTNCVSVIKEACERQTTAEKRHGEDGEDIEGEEGNDEPDPLDMQGELPVDEYEA